VVSSPAVGSLAFQQGDYRDILSLVRVLVNGPASKAEVDIIIDRYAISNLQILHHKYTVNTGTCNTC
jgi:hypothetical protein